MSDENILTLLFEEPSSKPKLITFFAAVMLVVAYNASVFFVIRADDIAQKDTTPSFEISFSEITYGQDETITVGDGETQTITFTAPDDVMQNHSGFGYLKIVLTYDETSGEFADPCDTVLADISPTGANAQWSDEGNVLSDGDSDCNAIELFVLVYPGYSGDASVESGKSAAELEEKWSDATHGAGVFSIDIEVQVNEPPTSGLPTVADDGETVTVAIEAVFFDAQIVELT